MKWLFKRQVRRVIGREKDRQKLYAEQIIFAIFKADEALKNLDPFATEPLQRILHEFRDMAYKLHVTIKYHPTLMPEHEIEDLVEQILWNKYSLKKDFKLLMKELSYIKENSKARKQWQDLDKPTPDD